MRYNAVIKGTAAQAFQHAQERGFVFNTLMEVHNDATGTVESVGFLHTEHGDELQGWFCEKVMPIPGFGFPAGTLLHYVRDDR